MLKILISLLISFTVFLNLVYAVPLVPSNIKVNIPKKITERSGLNRFRDNNGRLLRNHKYAGKSVPIRKFSSKLSKKYRKPIKFNKYGYPDFSKYSKMDIKTSRLTGNHQNDVRIVEKITKQKHPKWKKRVGYTWHHHQDGKTMQYIPTDLHSAIPHSGGASRLRVLKNK